MKTKKFSNVLNDTIDYFLLGDIEFLRTYKLKNNLSDDLATEFTTNESGDEIVKEGVLIPMSKIVNQPYTIIFNTSEEKSEFLKKGNELQFRKKGYILKVENKKLFLFTWWILNNFSDEELYKLVNNPEKWNKPCIEIENGWYDVEILGGFTNQKTTFKDKNGKTITGFSLEPTFEFILHLKDTKGIFNADTNQSFALINS